MFNNFYVRSSEGASLVKYVTLFTRVRLQLLTEVSDPQHFINLTVSLKVFKRQSTVSTVSNFFYRNA